MRILFVCHGNICRSPMAEFIMKDLVRKAGLDWHIESCATSTEEIGNDIYPPVKRCLSDHGIHFERRYARRIEYSDYLNFDMIIAMDRWNIRNMEHIINGDPGEKVTLLMSHCGVESNVDDPWYTGDYEKAYNDITRGCRGLMDEILHH